MLNDPTLQPFVNSYLGKRPFHLDDLLTRQARVHHEKQIQFAARAEAKTRTEPNERWWLGWGYS